MSDADHQVVRAGRVTPIEMLTRVETLEDARTELTGFYRALATRLSKQEEHHDSLAVTSMSNNALREQEVTSVLKKLDALKQTLDDVDARLDVIEEAQAKRKRIRSKVFGIAVMTLVGFGVLLLLAALAMGEGSCGLP